MKDKRKQLLNRVALGLFGAAQRSFERNDIAKAERRGARIGMILYRLDKKHREQTYRNLALAFPEWNEREREDVARKTFQHFGIVLADFLRSGKRTDQELLESIEIDGFENVEEAEARDKGIIALTAHLGNWERFAHLCTAKGRDMTVVARDADDTELQDRVMEMREHTGIKVLSRGNAARGMLQVLRKKGIVGILPDQNSNECFVPFFGKPAGTVMGPAVLHQRTGATLLPCYCVRTGVGQYRAILLPAIDPDNVEKDPVALTAQANLVLESVVREYPEQYLWLHDRWRSARRRGMV